VVTGMKKNSRSNKRGETTLKRDFKNTASVDVSQKKSPLKRHGTMRGN